MKSELTYQLIEAICESENVYSLPDSARETLVPTNILFHLLQTWGYSREELALCDSLSATIIASLVYGGP